MLPAITFYHTSLPGCPAECLPVGTQRWAVEKGAVSLWEDATMPRFIPSLGQGWAAGTSRWMA